MRRALQQSQRRLLMINKVNHMRPQLGTLFNHAQQQQQSPSSSLFSSSSFAHYHHTPTIYNNNNNNNNNKSTINASSTAQLVQYLVNKGDIIQKGQIIAEMMIDGVKYKISSTESGEVKQLVYKAGDPIASIADPIIVMRGDLQDLKSRQFSNAQDDTMTNEEQQKWNEHVQKVRDEEMNERRRHGLKLVKKSLLIATAIDLALFLALLLFVREYWGAKTIPEFKAKMKELIASVIGEDKSLDAAADPEAFDKLKNMFATALGSKKEDDGDGEEEPKNTQQQVDEQ